MYHILICDDEQDIVIALKIYLSNTHRLLLIPQDLHDVYTNGQQHGEGGTEGIRDRAYKIRHYVFILRTSYYIYPFSSVKCDIFFKYISKR